MSDNSEQNVYSPLDAISPLDGRYVRKVKPLTEIFSERSLINNRGQIMLDWLLQLISTKELNIKQISDSKKENLEELIESTQRDFAVQVKNFEDTTNHDLKAVELYLQSQLEQFGLAELRPWLHFGLTSWDINNLANVVMLQVARDEELIPKLIEINKKLDELAKKNAEMVMLGYTHGQVASPTTLGKEFRVYEQRVSKLMELIKNHKFSGKLNGAVGNYNALVSVYPDVDWVKVSKKFIKSYGLEFTKHTTQIEPYDNIVLFFNYIAMINRTCVDLAKDMSAYISLDYIKQAKKISEVGSSTMPHKTNPIDFENAEGNLKVANSLISCFVETLQESRLQRDLSNSTIIRNFGVALGHSYLAWGSLLNGLSSIKAKKSTMLIDLDNNWQVLAEAVQTRLRSMGEWEAYDKLKQLTKNKTTMRKKDFQDMISKITKKIKLKRELRKLDPKTYYGEAVNLAKKKT